MTMFLLLKSPLGIAKAKAFSSLRRFPSVELASYFNYILLSLLEPVLSGVLSKYHGEDLIVHVGMQIKDQSFRVFLF